jgi:hypothetical protein
MVASTRQHSVHTITTDAHTKHGKTSRQVQKKDGMGVYTPRTKSKKGGSNIVQQCTEANRSANDAQASTNDTNPPAAGASSDTNANKTMASGTNGADSTIKEQADAHNSTARKTTDNIIIAMAGKDADSANMDVNDANTQNVDDTLHANKDAPGQDVSSYSNMHVILC